MTEATRTIDSCLSVESIRRGSAWQYIDDYRKFTHVDASLGVSAGIGIRVKLTKLLKS